MNEQRPLEARIRTTQQSRAGLLALLTLIRSEVHWWRIPDGEFAAAGARAVITPDVPAHGLVYGSPSGLHGYVFSFGRPLFELENHCWKCEACGESHIC